MFGRFLSKDLARAFALLPSCFCAIVSAQETLSTGAYLNGPTSRTFTGQECAGVGMQVATAGDVNGDGHTDVLVGTPNYDGVKVAEGRAMLFLGTGSGLARKPSWQLFGKTTDAEVGRAVASAGDVNGDGFDDVLVSADKLRKLRRVGGTGPNPLGLSPGNGTVLLFYGSPTGLSKTPGWSATDVRERPGFGDSVDGVGDVNGDGFDDVLVGASGRFGSAALYLGGSSGLGASPSWRWTSSRFGTEFGYALAGLGDVNGDGYDDIAIGAPEYFLSGIAGAVRVWHGSPSGIQGEPELLLTTVPGRFGDAIAGAGDIDGDGYDDMVTGASIAFGGNGVVCLFRGGPNGLDPQADFNLEGREYNAYFGASVAGAGDVDNDGYDDGYDDVLVGHAGFSYLVRHSTGAVGRVVLFRGSADGLSEKPADVGYGTNSGDFLGASVAGLGDLNSDGFADFVVSVDDATGSGRIEIFEGRERTDGSYVSSMPSQMLVGDTPSSTFGIDLEVVGDVNGDGYDDLVVLDGLSRVAHAFYGSPAGPAPVASWFANGPDERSVYGEMLGDAIAYGDVNGDGFNDVALQDWATETVRVFHGSSGGLSMTASTSIPTQQAGSGFGKSVWISDVDRDGFDDLAIGAEYYDGSLVDSGAVYLHMGSATGIQSVADWSKEGAIANGRYGSEIGGADVDGDGFGDLFFTGRGGEIEGYYGSRNGLTKLDWTPDALGYYAHWGAAPVGDVNNDGYDDLAITNPLFSGRVLVYHGSRQGLATVAAWDERDPSQGGAFGTDVATADFNGDGYSDVAVAAPASCSGEEDEGVVFLYLGSAAGLPTTAAKVLESNWEDETLGLGLAAGDLNGDGKADLVVAKRDDSCFQCGPISGTGHVFFMPGL